MIAQNGSHEKMLDLESALKNMLFIITIQEEV